MTHEELKTWLNYDIKTGCFTWKKKPSRRVCIGDIAGTLDTDGYRKIKVMGKVIRSHRLAWFYVPGFFPEQELDHINRIRSDNRIENLRLASRSENAKNKEKSKANTSGFKGVSQQKKTGKWVAHIKINGKNKHIGTFESPKRASIAYLIASHFHHKEFSPTSEATHGDSNRNNGSSRC